MRELIDNLKARLERRLQVAPLDCSQTILDQWFDRDYGQNLLVQQRRCLAQMPAVPGYHLMQLGVSPRPLLLNGFSNLHPFVVAAGDPVGDVSCSAVADFSELPLPNDILDGALLHHALEFSTSPHEVLREVVRTLIPGGHLVLVVFNPHSLLGVIKNCGRLVSSEPFWRYHDLRKGRILDWLKVLHCQPVWLGSGGYNLPLCRANWLERMQKLDDFCFSRQTVGGAFYVVLARKQVARPILRSRQIWAPKPASSGLLSLKSLNKEKSVENR